MFHYILGLQYNLSLIMHFVAVVLYCVQAMQRAKEEGLLNHLKRGKKSKVKFSRMFLFRIHNATNVNFVSSEAIAGMNAGWVPLCLSFLCLFFFFLVTKSLSCMVHREVNGLIKIRLH